MEANSNTKDATVAAKDTKSDVNAKRDTAKGSKTVDAPEASKSSQKDSTQVFPPLLSVKLSWFFACINLWLLFSEFLV